MAIRFLGEKPTPTRTTETRAVKNWQQFRGIVTTNRDQSERGETGMDSRRAGRTGYPRFSREDYRGALRWLMALTWARRKSV